VFGGGSSDRGLEGLLEQSEAMRAALSEVGLGDLPMVVTENGAPRIAVGETPGSPIYAANYLIKSMVMGHYEGWLGIDWFAQGDGNAAAQSTDSFASMGLYLDYSMTTEVSAVTRSAQGDAYAWLATWMQDTAADTASLTSLSLPDTVRGAAFRRGDGSRVFVLWAHTATDESATTAFDLDADSDARVSTFDVDGGAASSNVSPSGGHIALSLTSTPTVIELP
jgi:hypothetical protein